MVSDQAQRRQALDPSTSFIVQAPAGSGKTELLIQRFLVLLARVEYPEAIVAITFTRKAAAEMRHRIIRALWSASGPPPEAPHEKYTWNLAQRALAQNEHKKWNLLESPLRLRIQTIDSLCSLLVRRMPWISRMGALLKPEEDAQHLHQKAARRTLELFFLDRTPDNLSESIGVLLEHLDNHMGRLEKLLAVMLGRRDQWVRHVDGSGEFATTRDALESALSHVVMYALERIVAEFPRDQMGDVVELARFAAGNLQNKGGMGSAIDACLELQEFPDAAIDSLPVWLGIAELFLTRSGKRRQRYTVREGFLPNNEQEKNRIREICLDEDIITQLHELRQLPSVNYEERQWEVLDALMQLLLAALTQLRSVFQENGTVDFMEIAMAAQEAMRSYASSSTYGSVPDMTIHHLLVDEFQDTSQSQYELLEKLIWNWGNDDRTLFLVGDPMQSIYGFREAEVSLFSHTRINGLGAIRFRSLVLETNFRSSTEIVNWVNQSLRDAFSRVEDPVTGSVSYSPSTAFRADIGKSTIKIHPFFSNDLEGQAERVVRIIEETRIQRPGSTVAVLVQARRHLLDIIALLRRRQIAFRSVEIDPLGERPVVRDLMALTQALLHPGNRIAWFSILRAPWCGLTLADIQTVIGDDFHTDVLNMLSQHRGELSADGRCRVERILPILEDACALRGRLSVRRWVEGVWLALGGPAGVETPTELEDAMAYLALLEKSVDSIDLRDEKKFLEDVERLFAPSDVEAGDELQLLTIHKAKGLEFDTVILPGLGYRTRGDDPRLLMWREYNDGDQSHLLLAPIRKTGGGQDAVYGYLQSIENKRRDHESTRLLYVAVTRARKDLHLIGHINQKGVSGTMKKPESRSLLSKIWNAAEPDFAHAWENRHQEIKVEDVDSSDKRGGELLRLSSDWIPAEIPEELIWKARRERIEDGGEDREPVFEWVGDMQRRVGIVVHRMLQKMWFPDSVDFNENVLRNALYHEGLAGENLENALLDVTRALKNTLGDSRGRWILSRHESDEREFALTAMVGVGTHRYILDRTFVEDDRRWIVDYKTSTHAGSDVDQFLDNEVERYRSQMEKYAHAMRAIDGRPIFLGLYFPVLKGWRQWQYVESDEP